MTTLTVRPTCKEIVSQLELLAEEYDVNVENRRLEETDGFQARQFSPQKYIDGGEVANTSESLRIALKKMQSEMQTMRMKLADEATERMKLERKIAYQAMENEKLQAKLQKTQRKLEEAALLAAKVTGPSGSQRRDLYGRSKRTAAPSLANSISTTNSEPMLHGEKSSRSEENFFGESHREWGQGPTSDPSNPASSSALPMVTIPDGDVAAAAVERIGGAIKKGESVGDIISGVQSGNSLSRGERIDRSEEKDDAEKDHVEIREITDGERLRRGSKVGRTNRLMSATVSFKAGKRMERSLTKDLSEEERRRIEDELLDSLVLDSNGARLRSRMTISRKGMGNDQISDLVRQRVEVFEQFIENNKNNPVLLGKIRTYDDTVNAKGGSKVERVVVPKESSRASIVSDSIFVPAPPSPSSTSSSYCAGGSFSNSTSAHTFTEDDDTMNVATHSDNTYSSESYSPSSTRRPSASDRKGLAKLMALSGKSLHNGTDSTSTSSSPSSSLQEKDVSELFARVFYGKKALVELMLEFDDAD